MREKMTEKIRTENAAIDIAKLTMAILVIGIHTEPFSSSFWLDKAFGIVTRLCVPFFFVTSAYFFFSSGKSLKQYLGRLLLLYGIWSVIYLPFEMPALMNLSWTEIFRRYLWDGNDHALWYLLASVIATLLVWMLRKFLSARMTLSVSFGLLFVGCLCSTWSPMTERFGGV